MFSLWLLVVLLKFIWFEIKITVFYVQTICDLRVEVVSFVVRVRLLKEKPTTTYKIIFNYQCRKKCWILWYLAFFGGFQFAFFCRTFRNLTFNLFFFYVFLQSVSFHYYSPNGRCTRNNFLAIFFCRFDCFYSRPCEALIAMAWMSVLTARPTVGWKCSCVQRRTAATAKLTTWKSNVSYHFLFPGSDSLCLFPLGVQIWRVNTFRIFIQPVWWDEPSVRPRDVLAFITFVTF